MRRGSARVSCACVNCLGVVLGVVRSVNSVGVVGCLGCLGCLGGVGSSGAGPTVRQVGDRSDRVRVAVPEDFAAAGKRLALQRLSLAEHARVARRAAEIVE